MSKVWILAIGLTASNLLTSQASAASCLCPKAPMQYLGDDKWLHYAMVCQTGSPHCFEDYPTSHIGSYAVGYSCYNCPGTCGPCYPVPFCPLNCLPSQPAAADYNLHFGGSVKKYSELDDEQEFRPYLIQNSYGATPEDYADHKLLSRFAVRLHRVKNGMIEPFHAIVWEFDVSGNGRIERGYLGFEVDFDGPPTDERLAHSLHNAVLTTFAGSGGLNHDELQGLLQVQFDRPNSTNDSPDSPLRDIAYIRLHDVRNDGVDYPPYRLSDPVKSVSYCEPACCNRCSPQCSPAPRAWRGRSRYRPWRRCR